MKALHLYPFLPCSVNSKMVARILVLLLSLAFSLKPGSATGKITYELKTWTHNWKDSGTDNRIYARVYGEKETTGWHLLEHSGYKDHETGDSNTYKFEDVDVKDIRCVELKTDGDDAYLVDKMEVEKLGSAGSEKSITNSEYQHLSTESD